MISANENKCLKTVTDYNFKSSIFSLSPSEFTMRNFDGEIARLLTEYGIGGRLTSSFVLYYSFRGYVHYHPAHKGSIQNSPITAACRFL